MKLRSSGKTVDLFDECFEVKPIKKNMPRHNNRQVVINFDDEDYDEEEKPVKKTKKTKKSKQKKQNTNEPPSTNEKQNKLSIIIPNEEPLTQCSQRCAWCDGTLWLWDETETYNGNNPSYKDWICHKRCNETYLLSNTLKTKQPQKQPQEKQPQEKQPQEKQPQEKQPQEKQPQEIKSIDDIPLLQLGRRQISGYDVSESQEKNDMVIETIDESNDEVNEKLNKIPPLQVSQRCAWCIDILTMNDEIEDYNGNDPAFAGWMCHKLCNIPNKRKKIMAGPQKTQSKQVQKKIQKDVPEEFQYADDN